MYLFNRDNQSVQGLAFIVANLGGGNRKKEEKNFPSKTSEEYTTMYS